MTAGQDVAYKEIGNDAKSGQFLVIHKEKNNKIILIMFSLKKKHIMTGDDDF